MDPFYCLIEARDILTPELVALNARTQSEALADCRLLLMQWPRAWKLDLYRGEKLIWRWQGWHTPANADTSLEVAA